MRNRLSQPSIRLLVAILGGILVHSVLPPGMFAPHDVLFRALVTGVAVAAFATALQAAYPRRTP